MSHFSFRHRKHFVAHRISMSTGEVSSRLLNCGSATCSNWSCQDHAVSRSIRAIRFAMRGQGVRMLTLTKLPDSDAARLFHDSMLRKLRKLGFKAYGIPVVEAHAQGLVHVHVLLKSDAPDSAIRKAFESVRPSLAVTEWSDFHLTDTLGPSAGAYVLKSYANGLRAKHLELNAGSLLLARSRGFFRAAGISGMADCAKAEGARARAFMALAGLAGLRAAERMTGAALTAEEIEAIMDGILAREFAALSAEAFRAPLAITASMVARMESYPLRV